MWQWHCAACFYPLSLISLFTFYKRGIPLPAPTARSYRCARATEHAQFITIPTEGLGFNQLSSNISRSRFLVLPQLVFSTCLFPTSSLPFALISTFSSLPLTFMSSTRQQQDRTDIRESSFKNRKKKNPKPLIHTLACSEPFGEKAHLCEFKSLHFHTEMSLAFCLWHLLSTLGNLSEWPWIS